MHVSYCRKGDFLLEINGKDVTKASHETVVTLIRNVVITHREELENFSETLFCRKIAEVLKLKCFRHKKFLCSP